MLKPKITLKQEECPAQIAAIAEETIKDSYPKYYPSGAVAFFLNLHNGTCEKSGTHIFGLPKRNRDRNDKRKSQ